MSIYVVFSNEDGTAATAGRKLVCGPYHSVELEGEHIYATQAHQRFALASGGQHGWRVNDGIGNSTEAYRVIRFRAGLLVGEEAQG